MRVAIAQLNLLVGAVADNADRVIGAAARARDELAADLVVFPELTLTGYPPEDLLLHAGLRAQVESALQRVASAADGIAVLFGAPEWADDCLYNTAFLADAGAIRARYRKQALPNYAVFDEKRYFDPGHDACVVEVAGVKLGITVCEDLWVNGPAHDVAAAGADILLNISASPFQVGRQHHRENDVFGPRAREIGIPVLSVNLVGGQDELVFDGGSVVVDVDGAVCHRAPSFDEDLSVVEFKRDAGGVMRPASCTLAGLESEASSIWRALVAGTRDYVEKNGFHGVVLGLSGGIDSALCAVLVTDALGADRVHTVMMPSRFTSTMSVEDAASLAKSLGVDHREIGIEPGFKAMLASLAGYFDDRGADTTEQNLQARLRGTLLMALSNKIGWLVLLTGNKSEFAVGYSTLYGDMAGGFAPLKDVSKTLVYRLARWRNERSPVIPQRIIDRAPTAELAHGQLDEDSLPPYEALDRIIADHVEGERSPAELVAMGHDADDVASVVELIRRNEYKRRQSAPGVRITGRAFGRDRRYPITSGYR